MISVQFDMNKTNGRGVVLDNICPHTIGCDQHPTILIAALSVFGEPICDVLKDLSVLLMRWLRGMNVLHQITVTPH